MLNYQLNRPILPPKGLKILDVPIHLSCHFSVRTHWKSTLQPQLGILIYQYLRTTSNVNLSPTQSSNIRILFKCDIQSCHELGSLRCEIGASPIRYMINKSSKPLLKIDKNRQNFLITSNNVDYKILESTDSSLT